MAKNLRKLWVKAKRQLEIAIPARQCIGLEGQLSGLIPEDLMEIDDEENKVDPPIFDKEAEKVAVKEKERLRIKKEREEEIEQRKIREEKSKIKEENERGGESQGKKSREIKEEDEWEINQKNKARLQTTIKNENEKGGVTIKREDTKKEINQFKKNLPSATTISSAKALNPTQFEDNPTIDIETRIEPPSLSLELEDGMDDKKALKTALEASWQYLTEIDTFNAFAAPVCCPNVTFFFLSALWQPSS